MSSEDTWFADVLASVGESSALDEYTLLRLKVIKLAETLENYQPASPIGPLHSAGIALGCKESAKAIRALFNDEEKKDG